jgi:hydroxyethylthiazole kinase-like uncharacterized protein yjeF
MKILSSQQIRDLDAYTIAHEPIASIDLMERASAKFCEAFINYMELRYAGNAKDATIYIFCGKGNNGGDGLAIARLLRKSNYKSEVFIVQHSEEAARDFTVNVQKYNTLAPIKGITETSGIPDMNRDTVVIDAIFGSGLSRPVIGIAAEVIAAINNSRAFVVSVDVPSGLYCDSLNSDEDAIIQAAITFTFHSPKLSFLLPQSGKYVGQFEVLDIGLNKQFADGVDTNYHYISATDIRSKIKPRAKFSHKGTYGHALIVAGGEGKMGAAVLCTQAALRSGAGLISCYSPQGNTDVLQIAVPEAMIAAKQEILNGDEVKKFTAVGIGPGLGVSHDIADLIEYLCKVNAHALVLDADALNTLAMKPHLLDLLPKGSIITPHPKEFKRLVGDWSDDMDRLQKQIELAQKRNIVVVLKGAHTSIALPDGTVYFNCTGNAGMAKGGSGDVLTGIITSLLAQGYLPEDAAMIGVYIHGFAGDLAAGVTGLTAMKAGDLIDNLPGAFSSFE